MSYVATHSLLAHVLIEARRVGGTAVRWVKLLGPTVVVFIVVLSLRGRPAPGLYGGGLLVSLALIALVAGIALVLRRPGDRSRLAALGAMGAASSTLVWTQHGGPGVAGLFLVVGYAAMGLPVGKSLPVLALAVLELPVLALHVNRTPDRIAMIDLAIVAFYALGAYARRAKEDHKHTKARLEELIHALEDARRRAHRLTAKPLDAHGDQGLRLIPATDARRKESVVPGLLRPRGHAHLASAPL